MFNPDALDVPPFIEKTDRNSIIVNFYSSTDQSLTKPPDLLPSRSIEDLSRSVFTSKDAIETEFDKNYMEAVSLIREAQSMINTDERIEAYFDALKFLKQAALVSERDIQISQALRQRDLLLRVMPKLIIRNVQMTVLALDVESSSSKVDISLKERLLKQLRHAERYSSTKDQKMKINTLKSILH